MWTEDDERKFMNTFENIRVQLRNHSLSCFDLFEPVWDKAMVYNVPHGKKKRGIAVVQAYETLMQSDTTIISEEQIEMSRIVGWCVEMFLASMLITDDIMDASETRRNQKCWYLIEPKCAPIHSACMLSSLYFILKSNCKHHSKYLNLIETFTEMEMLTEIGQVLDMKSEVSKQSADAFNTICHSRNTAINKMKTAYGTGVLPIKLALFLANIDDPETHRISQDILLKIGILFQVQNDFLDTYGDPAVTGKIGNDIQDGKCSWLAAEAMKRMNESQKKIFKENYGKNDLEAVDKIKNIYNELNLRSVFQDFEEKQYNEIKKEIDELQNCSPQLKSLMLSMINTYYKRQK